MLLGSINGGLGFMLSAPLGAEKSPLWGVVLYSVVSIIIFLFYILVAVVSAFRSSRTTVGSDSDEAAHKRQTAAEKAVLDGARETSASSP